MTFYSFETVLTDSTGLSTLPSKSAFALATGESGPTPVMAHSGDVSRLEPTTSTVPRSQVWGGRSSAAIPEVEVRPETQLEPEIENRTEIEVSVSTISERDLGATGPLFATEIPSKIVETVSKYVSGDRPEIGIPSSLLASQEVNPNQHSHTIESPKTHFSHL